MSVRERKIRLSTLRVADTAAQVDHAPTPINLCGCPMCRLRRVQQPQNHSLSAGVYDRDWPQIVSDKSPSASLMRADPNKFAEINRRNAEFWNARKEQGE